MRYATSRLLALLFSMAICQSLFAQTDSLMKQLPPFYSQAWKTIDSLNREGLFRSALERAEAVYERARQDGLAEQLTKAALVRAVYSRDLTEAGQVEAVKLLQEEARTAPFPANRILQSLLADLYAQYLQNNYWRLTDRTEIVDFRPEDLQTWSIQQLIDEATRLHLEASSDQALQEVSLTDLPFLVTKGENAEGIRPTLFDLLAYRAVEYLVDDRSFLPEPVHQYVLDHPAAFAEAGAFSRHAFTATDSSSHKFQTLLLFQRLLAFHLDDEDPRARIEADLLRLLFAKNHYVGENKDTLFASALQNLYDRFSGHPSGTEVAYQLARHHRELAGKYDPLQGPSFQWENKKALEYCDAAIRQFPESYGANQCAGLRQDILRQSIEVNMENALLPDQAALLKISFTNLERASFTLIRITQEDKERIYSQYGEERHRILKRLKTFRSWSVELPDQRDYNEHAIETALDPLPYGEYLLIFSRNDNWKKDQEYDLLDFVVSRIGFVSRDNADRNTEFLLMDRETGQPLAGVEATFFFREYNSPKKAYESRPIGSAISDERGLVTALASNRGFQVRFRKGDDELFTGESYYNYGQRPTPSTQVRSYFFTDRAFYRPGQTVYFKGVAIRKFPDERQEIVAGESVTVALLDVNFQEIAQLELITNEFGTFHGQFVLPSGGLTGQMTLRSSLGRSTHRFSMEAYKRPRFEVGLQPLEGQPSVGDSVTINGEALNYLGSPVDGATVKYRVTRNAFVPFYPWLRYRPFPLTSGAAEIAYGTTQTGPDGSFTITFEARLDRNIPADRMPQFNYRIEAEVVDITGETHTARRSFTLGYRRLELTAELSETLDRTAEATLQISTANLDGQFTPAAGTLNIYRLDAPDRPLIDRYWEKPDLWQIPEADFRQSFPHYAYGDEDDPFRWPREALQFSAAFNTDQNQTIALPLAEWPVGAYLVELEALDSGNRPVEYRKVVTVYDSEAGAVPPHLDVWSTLEQAAVQPGDTAALLLATNGPVFLEIERNEQILDSRWVTPEGWRRHTYPVTEADRGNFLFLAAYARYNRVHSLQQLVEVPFSNKELSFEYLTFRDRLRPGQEEEWRIKISGPQKDQVAAEMVATLYDASLDAFTPHRWSWSLYPSRNYSRRRWNVRFFSGLAGSYTYNAAEDALEVLYRSYPELEHFGLLGFGYGMESVVVGYAKRATRNRKMRSEAPEVYAAEMAPAAAPPPPAPSAEQVLETAADSAAEAPEPASEPPLPVRTNLDETVFFLPELYTDAEGNVEIRFTMNEALTRWKFMAMAHTKDLQYGFTQQEVVTQKELMVLPNIPRFVREGDIIELNAKINNLTDSTLAGEAQLTLFDAISGQPLNLAYGLKDSTVRFVAAGGQSSVAAWAIRVPAGLNNALTYRVTARAGNFTDGEESTLPVLSNRMLVTESLPVFVRAGQSKTVTLQSMEAASPTATAHRFTLEFTSNPAWLAVKALPYLMEYPHACSEQIFSRLYANSLAAAVVDQNPEIREVFDRWKAAGDLKSPLQKNEELKAVLLQETPWVLDAQSQEQQQQQIALLFDLERMAREQYTDLLKLQERQLASGAFAWFPGGNDNFFITSHILAGFGHLDRLGVAIARADLVADLTRKALAYTDNEIARYYAELKRDAAAGKTDLKADHLANWIIHYLYMRSFFDQQPLDRRAEEAVNYFLEQSREFWLDKGLYQEAQIGLTQLRTGDLETATRILKSLTERALYSDELGMYWKYPGGYFFHQLPIETHTLLMEFFQESEADPKLIDEQKLWLLRNKQTNDWGTTKATAEAIYVLLREKGESILSGSQQVDIGFPLMKKRDYRKVLEQAQANAEAGTGYFKLGWNGEAVQSDMHTLEVTNPNKNVSWGAIYWQYFEQLDRIRTFEETPLQLKKALFREIATPEGPKLEAITPEAPLQPGDKVIVRIELRVDRAMEYVHLKDMRSAGFEPINVFSGYRWQGGLGYYESTQDVTTHFFIDYLPTGTYVFEYPLRVIHRGTFSNGISSIQCMYAPEFSSHSEGLQVEVK